MSMIVKNETGVSTPAVLIQDSVKLEAYYVNSSALKQYEVDDLPDYLSNVAVFYISSDILEPINQVESVITDYESLNVLIFNEDSGKKYLVESNDLMQFKVPQPKWEDLSETSVTFIMPTGNEYFEDVPKLNPTMLQSNTPTRPLT